MKSYTYERVTFRPFGANRARSVILRNPIMTAGPTGTPVLTGTECRKDGEPIAPAGADERVRVISADRIRGRKALQWDLHYAELVEVGS